MSPSAADRHIYRISIWRYLIMWWVLGPFLAFGLHDAIFGAESRGAGILIVCIMSPSLVFWHWFARKARLEISADGVRQRELGGGVDAAWHEIADMRLDRGHEGFITAHWMESKGAERLARYAGMAPAYDDQDMQLIAERRFIPFSAFAFHLRRGDLREVILRCAPHLRIAFDRIHAPPNPTPSPRIDAPPSSHPAPPTARRRNVWLPTGVLIAAALAVAFILIHGGEHWQAWFFTVAYGFLDLVLALCSAGYAWLHFQKKRWFFGALSTLFAVIMAAWVVIHWSQFQRLRHEIPAARTR